MRDADGTAAAPAAEGPAPQVFRIVRGEPTDVELAALVAVLSARAAAAGPTPPATRSAWNAPSRLVRRPFPHGPDGWLRSARP